MENLIVKINNYFMIKVIFILFITNNKLYHKNILFWSLQIK